MGMLDNVKNLLAQYAAGGGSTKDVAAHFHEVVDAGDTEALSHGIAEALRSDQTPPFGQMVAELFSNATTEQKAAMLNALLGAATPEMQAKLSALLPGAAAASVTGSQAGAVSSETVTNVAQQVEQHNPSVIDRMSAFYAQHPTLVKTLGTAAMMIAMRKIAQRQSASHHA